MTRQYHLKYKIKSEINVIPFLDILLVLLIIFMIMPSKLLMMQQQNFEIDLPKHDATSNFIKNKKLLVTIEIIKADNYNLIINDKKILHISLNTLISEITTTTLNNPNFTYLIAASKEEKYNEIITMLNALNNIGINSIGLITYLTHEKNNK